MSPVIGRVVKHKFDGLGRVLAMSLSSSNTFHFLVEILEEHLYKSYGNGYPQKGSLQTWEAVRCRFPEPENQPMPGEGYRKEAEATP